MRKQIILHSLLLATCVVAATSPYRVHRRQTPIRPSVSSTPAAEEQSSSTEPPASSSTTPPASSSTPPPSSSSTSQSSSTTQQSSSSSTTPPSSTTNPPSSTPSQTAPASDSSSNTSESSTVVTSLSTGSDGHIVTVTTTSPLAPSTTSSDTAASDTKKDNGGGGSGVGTGTIVGLSVAGGIAVIGIVAFIIWKLTRKRFSDLDDEPSEAIKWPELGDSHTAGGTAVASTDALSREPSNAYAASSISRDHFDTASDPYAVPPLPQFNPNQPYHDDPHAASAAAYYDPYRGPVPHTFQDDALGESIPMNTYPPSGRTRSPGPGLAYDVGGRGSPAPGRIGTPGAPMGPAGYDTGRASPVVGRASPGPQYALGGQPEMARYHSPAPNPYS